MSVTTRAELAIPNEWIENDIEGLPRDDVITLAALTHMHLRKISEQLDGTDADKFFADPILWNQQQAAKNIAQAVYNHLSKKAQNMPIT